MLDSSKGQDQPLGDISNISLPGNGSVAVTPPAQSQPALEDLPKTSVPSDKPANLDDELLSIKQQALSQLSPIVNHLDQTPEEKFRTTMMMIQASDDQGLISKAYEAAQAITDEKEKAQALLDVINEINYFSQKNQN